LNSNSKPRDFGYNEYLYKIQTMDGTNPLDEIMKTDNEFMMPFDDYSIGEQEQPRIEPYKTYE
jgi:hypothetical protein